MNRPLRLLMTADTVGGVWTYALELARALGKHNVQISLATMGRSLTAEQQRELEGIPHVELFQSAYKLEWMEDPWMDLIAAGEWLLELERRLVPDIVHLNGFTHGVLPWRAPKLIVAHSCVLSWWRAVHGVDAAETWSGYQEAVAAGLRAADLVVAPSQAMLRNLEEHYGRPPARLVIPNGRKLPSFSPVLKEKFVFAAGRLWDAAKNISTLAAAAPELSWPVYVAGEDRSPDGAHTQHEHVRPLGRLSAEGVVPWLARASIYALPARYEPFGLSALEAGLAGCALVLGDIPSLREIWSDAAVFVSPEDGDQVAHTLRRLISNPSLTAQMGAQARCVASRYTPEIMAARYLAAYSEADQRFVLKGHTLVPCSRPNPNRDGHPEFGAGELGLDHMAKCHDPVPSELDPPARQVAWVDPSEGRPASRDGYSGRGSSRLTFRRRLPVSAMEEIAL